VVRRTSGDGSAPPPLVTLLQKQLLMELDAAGERTKAPVEVERRIVL
jgi:hypothetical protein